MPVGWPSPTKSLSLRERFIGMGRLRPLSGRDHDAWSHWGEVERNIWLWRATNEQLLDTKDQWPDRVTIHDFGELRGDESTFIHGLLERLVPDQAQKLDREQIAAAAAAATSRANGRSGGYQISTRESWTDRERKMLIEAETEIAERMAQWTQSKPK